MIDAIRFRTQDEQVVLQVHIVDHHNPWGNQEGVWRDAKVEDLLEVSAFTRNQVSHKIEMMQQDLDILRRKVGVARCEIWVITSMKSIFYGIYYLGAAVGALCALALEPLIACLVVMFTPLVLMTLALASGKVRFYHRSSEDEQAQDPEREAFPILAAIDDQDLTDDEAFNKYGHQIAIELDAFAAMLERRLAEVRHARSQYEQIMLKAK